MAALASTLMVCWNEAADRKLSVFSAALVMPSSTGSAVAGSPPCADDLLVDRLKVQAIDQLARQQRRCRRCRDAHAAQHLPHDDLDVLVVDAPRPASDTPFGSRPPGTRAPPPRPGWRRISCGFLEPSVIMSPGLTCWPSLDAQAGGHRDLVLALLALLVDDHDAGRPPCATRPSALATISSSPSAAGQQLRPPRPRRHLRP